MENRAQKLADRFAASSVLRMAEANAREAPTQPLFHYTTEQALDAIVKSEVFWFTSIYHMDDDEELSFGFAVAHSLMKVAVARGDPHVITFLAPMVEDYGFERIKERFEFYSVSFGQRDDAQQWTKYAAEGTGVALGFATPFFGLLKDRDFKPEEKIFLGKVAYGELAAKARHAGVIDSALHTVGQAYRQGLLGGPDDQNEFLREIAAQMYVEILWNSVTTKADKWIHQNETRLLAVNNRKDPQLKIVNGEVRPRVELPQPLLRPNLVEIMLGPKCEAGARDRIRKVLDDLGLGSVTISSAAPP